MSEGITELETLLLKDIDNAETLEELGFFTLDFLMTKSGMNRRYLDVLAARVTWVNGHAKTLDSCGKLIGVTRERVRQIEKELELSPINLIVAPKVLYKAIGIMKTSSNWDNYIEKLESKNIVSRNSNWSPNSLRDLTNLFNVPQFQIEFDSLFPNIDLVEIDESKAKIIRKHRNKLGLVDLMSVANDMGESLNRAFKFIDAMYPYCMRFNGIAMASTRKGGALSNVLLKQLTIQTPLSAETLLEGVERACNYRGTPMVGLKEDLLGLIRSMAGDTPSIDNLDEAVSDDFEFGELEIWLKNAISASNLGLMHRDELTELAIRDGVNPSSIGAYLSFSVIIRSLAPGIYSLVGTESDENTIRNYRNNFLAAYTPSKFDYKLINERIMELSLIPNSSLYTGGSLSIPAPMADLVSDFRFSTRCDCNDFRSDSDIRIAPSGYWISFTALLMHSRMKHGGQPGKCVVIEFDFISQSACLINK